MNAAEKARLAQQAQKQQKLQKKQERKDRVNDFIEWHGAGYIAFLILSIIAIIGTGLTFLFEILGLTTFSDSILGLFKIFFYVGLGMFVFTLILMIIGYYRSTFSYSGMSDDKTFFLLFGILHTILMVGLFILLIVSLSSGKLKYKKYLIDQENGVVYAQSKTGFEVIGVNQNLEEVVIKGNYDGFVVNAINKKAFKGNSTIKVITFDEGDINIGKKAFADSFALEKIIFKGDYKVVIGINAFKNCSNLKEIIFDSNEVYLNEDAFWECISLKLLDVNQATISPSLDALYQEVSLYYGNNLVIKVNGGSIDKMVNAVNTLILTDKANVNFYTRLTYSSTKINKLVIEDGFNFDQSKLSNINKVTSGEELNPMGYEIYLPSTITYIPDNFFGDVSREDIKVYFAGSETEWQAITIGTLGNSNYSNGKVKMYYNTPYAE